MLPSLLDELTRFPLYLEDEPAARTFSPALDVYEYADRYELRFDVPGLAKNELNVSFENGVLTIEGERKAPELPESATGRCERWTGKFSRSLTLPENADTTHIEAKLENGVLSLAVKKAEAAKPRQIVIG
ncbi:MAG: Hsp20/alpha crystallin family protein [Planctomycetota bacterium]